MRVLYFVVIKNSLFSFFVYNNYKFKNRNIILYLSKDFFYMDNAYFDNIY